MTTPRLERDSTRLLDMIRDSLERLNQKMEIIIEIQQKSRPDDQIATDALDVMTLLSLPDHLRKTAIVICRLKEATAQDVCEETKRARAVESGYLNQLVLIGHMKKKRKGRKTYFFIEK